MSKMTFFQIWYLKDANVFFIGHDIFYLDYIFLSSCVNTDVMVLVSVVI